MAAKTMSYFKNLVIVENFFCISRPQLIEDQKTKLVCEAVSITMSFLILSIITMDFVTVKHSIGSRIFELILVVELFWHVFGSRTQKVFVAIERLDEKCGVDEKDGAVIRSKTTRMNVLFLSSFILDVIGLTLLGVNIYFTIFLCVAFAAHDAELTFVALLIETINMRLAKLKNASPNAGSKVYRHILIATTHMTEQYTPRLLLLLQITLITTIANEFILVLTDPENILTLGVYLIWRESRAMYSLWLLCSAIARTGTICKELTLHLAGRLTQDQRISKEKYPGEYKTMKRWYSIAATHQPRYISGSILSVGLNTPIIALDLSINYMLIIVQMYLAYM